MIGLGVGIVLMVAQRIVAPAPFFRRKVETADPSVLQTHAETSHA